MWKPVATSVAIVAMAAISGQALAQSSTPQAGLIPDSADISVPRDRQAVPLFIPEQGSNHLLATSLLGARVVDLSGDEVGSVKDMILDEYGNAIGIVVSWGGLLGIGGKDVAISFGPARVQNGDAPESTIVRVSIPRDAIEAGPEFMDAEDRRTEAARTHRTSGASRP